MKEQIKHYQNHLLKVIEIEKKARNGGKLNARDKEAKELAAKQAEVTAKFMSHEEIRQGLQAGPYPGRVPNRTLEKLKNDKSVNYTTEEGGLTTSTFEEEEVDGGTREVDVLKNVILREEYLRRLTKKVRDC